MFGSPPQTIHNPPPSRPSFLVGTCSLLQSIYSPNPSPLRGQESLLAHCLVSTSFGAQSSHNPLPFGAQYSRGYLFSSPIDVGPSNPSPFVSKNPCWHTVLYPPPSGLSFFTIHPFWGLESLLAYHLVSTLFRAQPPYLHIAWCLVLVLTVTGQAYH